MAEDLLDHFVVIDKRDQFHLGAAVLTNERVNFPHLRDQLAPFLRRNARRVILGHVDHVYVRGVRGAGLGLALGSLAPGAIAVPPIIAHHLKPFVRDMLRDGRNELLGGEDFEIALGLGVHARTIDDGTVLGVVDHLLLGKGIADDVLRDALKSGGIVAPQRVAVVYTEPAVFPAQKLAGQLRREESLLDEHLDHSDAEELLQRPGAHPGRDVEHAVAREQPIGHQGVDMAIVPHVVAEGMNGHDHAELAGGPVEAATQKFEQTLVGDPAKLLQELAVVAEIDPQHDRQAEDVLAVGHREGNRAGNELAEEQHLLLVA